MKTITLLQDMTLDGVARKKGDSVKTSDGIADALIKQKLASETVSKK